MAPREATGTFPDQFLTFDYDTAIPLGMPQIHDAVPAAIVEGVTTNEPDGGISQQGGALNHVGISTMHHGDNNNNNNISNNSTHNSNSATLEQIDPLSIDPTLEDETSLNSPLPWASAQHNNNARLFSGRRRPSPLERPRSISSTVSATNRRPFSSISPAESQGGFEIAQHQHDIGSHTDDNSTSPLSTGSSYFDASTAPNSPLSVGSGSISNYLSPHTSNGGFTMVTSQRTRQGTFQLQSVLDDDVSVESEDEGMIPNLENTFDSVNTSGFVSDDWESSNMLEEEEEDDEDDDQQSLAPTNANLSTVGSDDSSDSMHMIYRNVAFDHDEPQSPIVTNMVGMDDAPPSPVSPGSIMLSFGPNTTVSDLKYFAERGCIVALLQALTTPRLITLGTRMLADYAKMSHRRVAVASNRRILEFVQRTMLQMSEQSDWLGREYAVETIRSLTATEASDQYLMNTRGLLQTLALIAKGGPFSHQAQEDGSTVTIPLASDKARLHACIAIMNLSCGKANKIEIAKVSDVLEAMRDVMLNSNEEARLKATTCVKNLSNADANDAALLGTSGLVEALAHVASITCSPETGATPCTTNACLALMNLSISKANKHRVFRTPGVMDSLMTVLERTTAQGSSVEARVKACSALSNLAIGYDNKIPMFNYPGFVDAILNVIHTDTGEARTKACSILWSFAAEMKNQVPVVRRGDILPALVRVADEDGVTEARFKCVAALTLLAESLDNAIPLLEADALSPLMDILHDAGPDPTQWKGQTASWCVGFMMNIAQSDEAVASLREAGVVELLAPLLTLDHYQSLKAAMAVTFCCRFDEGDECYDLLRKTESVVPKIISLLHNTLGGRGGNGYKYGVFTLRSSVGCIAALASGPDYMKERIATGPVFESLLQVVTDFCVDGGSPGAIVGGGRDDALSSTLAVRAIQYLTAHLIPIVGSNALPFGPAMEDNLLLALESFETCPHPELSDHTRDLATDAKVRIQGGRLSAQAQTPCRFVRETDFEMDVSSLSSNCCGFNDFPSLGEGFLHALSIPSLRAPTPPVVFSPSITDNESKEEEQPVRTFLLSDASTGRRFVVPTDPTGGRSFNDRRVWCFRRGRYCTEGEDADPNYVWTPELQAAYQAALATQDEPSIISNHS